MEFGVTITSGASNWQIFSRRADGTAEISVQGRYFPVRLSQELPLSFTRIEGVSAIVKARIALERTGEDVVPWTVCELFGENEWRVTFSHVPQGGLYRIETYMEYTGWDGLSCTRGDMVHHIGVGDVYLIAGQSNAAGRAKGPVEDAPDLLVHVFRTSGAWDLATHPLGETTGAKFVGHYENHNPGHSPWLAFGKRLARELGYPVGLVPCAYGGAPLRWWNPAENGALFQNLLAMSRAACEQPKGVLWIQGEAEGYEQSAETYLPRFKNLVKELRKAFDAPSLPVLTVQINRCYEAPNEALDRQWGIVREAQRQAAREIPGVTVVPSADLAAYDFIHNAAESNLVIGERCARAALATVYGRPLDWEAPEVEKAEKTAPDAVRLTFSRIRNWLNPYEVPAALLPFDAEDGEGLCHPVRYEVGRDTLTLSFPRPLQEKAVLHGAWRMYPGPAIPCDCMRMPMLSFYGLAIEEEEEGST